MAETNGTTEDKTAATAVVVSEDEKKPEIKTEQTADESMETNQNGVEDSTEDVTIKTEKTTTATAESVDAHPKLFVGRLPPGTKENELKDLFGKFGEVTHCDIVGKYGFVHMKDKSEADEALKELNNHTFNGSSITVQLSTSTSKKGKRKQNRKKIAAANAAASKNVTANANGTSGTTTKNLQTKTGSTPMKAKLTLSVANANNRRPNLRNGYNGPQSGMNPRNNMGMNRSNRYPPNYPPNRNMGGPGPYYQGPEHNGPYYPPPQQQQPPPMQPPMAPYNAGRDYYNRPQPDMYQAPSQPAPYYRSNGGPMPSQPYAPPMADMAPAQPPQQPYYSNYNRPTQNSLAPSPLSQQPPVQQPPPLYQQAPMIAPSMEPVAPNVPGYQLQNSYNTSPNMNGGGGAKYVNGINRNGYTKYSRPPTGFNNNRFNNFQRN